MYQCSKLLWCCPVCFIRDIYPDTTHYILVVELILPTSL